MDRIFGNFLVGGQQQLVVDSATTAQIDSLPTAAMNIHKTTQKILSIDIHKQLFR